MGDVVPSQISPRMRPLPLRASVPPVSAGGDDLDWPTSGIGVAYSGPDQWKQPVRVATSAGLTIATGLAPASAVDGVTLAAGDRVLVKDQASSPENGIYVCDASPYRASDMDADDEVAGAVVYVIAGTANGGTAWRCTRTTAPVVGVDAIAFAALGAGAGGSPNLDGGAAATTYGGTTAIDGGGA